MNESFSFRLKYRLPADWSEAWKLDGVRLLEHGSRRLLLEIVRTGPDARTALRQTIGALRPMIGKAELVEVAPDHVSLPEVARAAGVSHQALRKAAQVHADRFPAPLHEVDGAVWRLAELLEWFIAMRCYRVERRLLEEARAAAELNVRLELRRLRALRARTLGLIEFPRELERLLRKAANPI